MFNIITLLILLIIIVIILSIIEEIYYRCKKVLKINNDFVVLITGGIQGIGENLSYIISQ